MVRNVSRLAGKVLPHDDAALAVRGDRASLGVHERVVPTRSAECACEPFGFCSLERRFVLVGLALAGAALDESRFEGTLVPDQRFETE